MESRCNVSTEKEFKMFIQSNDLWIEYQLVHYMRIL